MTKDEALVAGAAELRNLSSDWQLRLKELKNGWTWTVTSDKLRVTAGPDFEEGEGKYFCSTYADVGKQGDLRFNSYASNVTDAIIGTVFEMNAAITDLRNAKTELLKSLKCSNEVVDKEI